MYTHICILYLYMVLVLLILLNLSWTFFSISVHIHQLLKKKSLDSVPCTDENACTLCNCFPSDIWVISNS